LLRVYPQLFPNTKLFCWDSFSFGYNLTVQWLRRHFALENQGVICKDSLARRKDTKAITAAYYLIRRYL